jgi:hypothetical protein
LSKRRRLDPKRFQQKDDDKGLFSFDPIRRYVFRWGLIAGAAGGIFMIRSEFFWQLIGVFAVVFISNYHINKASQRIPRWHATIVSFIGVVIGMFGIILLGSVVLTYFQAGSAAP